jgi:hypothetical protein
MQPFNIGKHEQMMQVFTSRELQIAAIGPSKVGSFETEAAYMACSRSKEVMQVLVKSQRDVSCGRTLLRGEHTFHQCRKRRSAQSFGVLGG